jgi:nucleotide-binding universal stress UspA family protein
VKRILVGLDGSPRAPGVLAAAIAIAKAQGGKVTLLRSVGVPPDLPQDFWKSVDEPLADVLKHRATEYLKACAASVPSGLLAGSEVPVGSPWQAICDAAHRLEAELIVIGSHGYSGMDHLLGTTAAKVVNHAKCSVLVVRQPSQPGQQNN